MTTWASEMTDYRDADGAVIPNVRRFVFDATSDSDGQFSIDLTALNLTSVLDVTCYCLGQSITPAANVANLLTAKAVSISNTAITGVLIKGNSLTVSIGLLLNTLIRGGAGINVRIVVAAY